VENTKQSSVLDRYEFQVDVKQPGVVESVLIFSMIIVLCAPAAVVMTYEAIKAKIEELKKGKSAWK
jgi:hypothetical protein